MAGLRVKLDSKMKEGLLPAKSVEAGVLLESLKPPSTVTDEKGNTYHCTGSLYANWHISGAHDSMRNKFLVTDSTLPKGYDVLLPFNDRNRRHTTRQSRRDGTIAPVWAIKKR